MHNKYYYNSSTLICILMNSLWSCILSCCAHGALSQTRPRSEVSPMGKSNSSNTVTLEPRKKSGNRLLRTHMCVKTIRHQLKLPIRWNERYSAVIFKPWQTHALIELHIFQLHWFALATFRSKMSFKGVVQTIIKRKTVTYGQCFQRELCH